MVLKCALMWFRHAHGPTGLEYVDTWSLSLHWSARCQIDPRHKQKKTPHFACILPLCIMRHFAGSEAKNADCLIDLFYHLPRSAFLLDSRNLEQSESLSSSKLKETTDILRQREAKHKATQENLRSRLKVPLIPSIMQFIEWMNKSIYFSRTIYDSMLTNTIVNYCG